MKTDRILGKLYAISQLIDRAMTEYEKRTPPYDEGNIEVMAPLMGAMERIDELIKELKDGRDSEEVS